MGKAEIEMDKRFLHVEGGKLINGDGETVILRGVNLGGWLIQESWMCPVNGEDRKWANLDTLTVLERRFSPRQVQELLDTYQDHWITPADFAIIAEMGCNVVRLPFWYRNFMRDESGAWITENPDDNPGFRRLDQAIAAAEQNGLYVILDLHGCPGGQSMDHCCGTLMENRLYTDEGCQAAMERLWRVLAGRYADCATVAAYDIMNEPQNNGGYQGPNSYDPWQPESWAMSNRIYDRMIKAVREVDDQHIITVEGIWRASNLPDPAPMGWSNMMYQVHLYDQNKDFLRWAAELAELAKQYQVAGLVGEFQNLDGISICGRYGLSWTTWTYKGTGVDLDTFFCFFGLPENADVRTDSFAEIKRKWGQPLLTEHFQEKKNVTRMLREGCRRAVTTSS
jgi:hypothetical protein